MRETVGFQIIYDGFALESHEMNVKELAPALFAIGELLEEANLILNDDKTKISVNIKASPTAGSLNIGFSVVQDILSQTVSIFSGNGVTSAVNILTLLGIGGTITTGGVKGLIAFIKWLKNRKIRNITKLESGNLNIELEDGDKGVQSKEIIKLFQSFKIRKSLEAIIKKPLEAEGVESISFKYNETFEKVEKSEAGYYVSPEAEQETIGESETETNLQFISVSFQEGSKWKFTDGNASFFAEIEDEEFIKKVQRNEVSFTKDDILKVILLKKQYLTGVGMKADYHIKKVISHRSAGIQIKLPFSDTEQGE